MRSNNANLHVTFNDQFGTTLYFDVIDKIAEQVNKFLTVHICACDWRFDANTRSAGIGTLPPAQALFVVAFGHRYNEIIRCNEANFDAFRG